MKKQLWSVVLCLVFLLAACGNKTAVEKSAAPVPAAEETLSFKAGTYTGTGSGNGGDIKVEVSFSESAVTDVKILEQHETPSVFAQVEAVLPEAIVTTQSLAVDTVSGASHSSAGVLAAVADCVRQAGGDLQAMREKPTRLAGEDKTYDCDVAVIGVGASGIMAAVNASKKGARVIGIEKSAAVANTNATKTTGAWMIESREQLKYDNHLTPREAFTHIMNGTHLQSNAKAVRTIVERSGEAMNLLLDSGLQFMFPFSFPGAEDMLSRGGHVYTSSHDERANIFDKLLKDNQVNCLFNTTAENLIVEKGVITGVECTDRNGTHITVHAGAVILSTGGFIANKEMIKEYFAGAEINVLGNTGCTGDGIHMGQAVGGQLGKNFSISLNEFGASNSKCPTVSAKEPWYPQNDVFKLPILGGLMVDSQGQRFMNEGEMCENTMYSGEPVIRNSKYYVVADQAYMDRLSHTDIVEFLGATSNMSSITAAFYNGMVLDTLFQQFDQAISQGWAYKADSIKELADFFHLEDLEDTVDQYNIFCRDGEDEQFYKKNIYLDSIDEGPFYIAEFEPSAWVTLGGLKCDGQFRVLTSENESIPGLYVAGVDADLWSVPYYQGGSCYGFSLTSGFVAGENAALFSLK